MIMTSSSSTTRQKSCVPCAKSKRKCDQGDPICSRCASKFLLCEYKSERRAGDQPQAGDTQDVPMSLLDDLSTQIDETDTGLSYPMVVNNGIYLVRGDDDNFFGAYEDLMLTNSYPKEVGYMDRERIQFCVKQLKSYPEKLFREGRTPFIHPANYNVMFRSLEDACGASALYASKTQANEEMVWQIISSKAFHLIEPFEPRTSWSPEEHLAAVQALIIFQIIRLFDGDIRQRADAERHNDTLVQWTDHLALRTGATDPGQNTIKVSWHSWVYQEVICRTIIVSRMVQAMFSIQKQGYCTLVEAVTELSFSMQKAFWYASSTYYWKEVMKEKSRFYAPRMDFTELLSSGTLDDVDELGLLMLVTYKGLDGVNEWIAGTGSTVLIK